MAVQTPTNAMQMMSIAQVPVPMNNGTTYISVPMPNTMQMSSSVPMNMATNVQMSGTSTNIQSDTNIPSTKNINYVICFIWFQIDVVLFAGVASFGGFVRSHSQEYLVRPHPQEHIVRSRSHDQFSQYRTGT